MGNQKVGDEAPYGRSLIFGEKKKGKRASYQKKMGENTLLGIWETT